MCGVKIMNDLISREQAIDALREKLAEYVPYLYSRKVEEIPLECEMTIRKLPSAESEIIRCKDCKHYHTFEDCISVHISWCDLGHSREIDISDDWFCGDAKPKEGEEDE